MRQFTIRDIDPEIEKKIRHIAKGSRKSLNQVIKEIVHKEFGSESPTSSLKQLAGGWTRKDADDFEFAIKSCEQVDEDMWK